MAGNETVDLAQLIDSLKYRPVATTAAQMRLAATTIEAQAAVIENLRKSFSEHCQDCCCARSWKALGITENTGFSIPEHIERLRAENRIMRGWLASGPNADWLIDRRLDRELVRETP